MSTGDGGRGRSASVSSTGSRSTRTRASRGGSRVARSAQIDPDKRCSENFEDDQGLWCDNCVHTVETALLPRAQPRSCECPLQHSDHPKHNLQKARRDEEAARRRSSACFSPNVSPVGSPVNVSFASMSIGSSGRGRRLGASSPIVTSSRPSSAASTSSAKRRPSTGATTSGPASRPSSARRTLYDSSAASVASATSAASAASAASSGFQTVHQQQQSDQQMWSPISPPGVPAAIQEVHGGEMNNISGIDTSGIDTSGIDASMDETELADLGSLSIPTMSPRSSQQQQPSSKKCSGVRTGFNAGLLRFVGDQMRESGQALLDMSYGEGTSFREVDAEGETTSVPIDREAYAASSNLLFPKSGIITTRTEDGQFHLRAVGCNCAARSDKATRCRKCDKALSRTRARVTSKEVKPRKVFGPSTRLDILSKDEGYCLPELRRLRKVERELKRQRMSTKLNRGLEDKGRIVKDEKQVKGIAQMCAEVTEALKKSKGEEDNMYLMMQLQSARLQEIVKRGGSSYAVPVHPAVLNFCVRFMKKSGRKSYAQMYKLLGLPAPSTVDKAAAALGARVGDRVCGVYARQIQLINEQLKQLDNVPDGFCNERIVSCPCDAFDIVEGCRFNIFKGTFDGLDDKEGSPYDVIEKRHKALSDEAALEAGETLDESGSNILDNLALAKYHLVIKIVAVCPGVPINEVVASGNFAAITPSVVTRLFTSLESSLLINDIYPITDVLDAAGENLSYMKGAADSKASEWLPQDLMSNKRYSNVDFSNRCVSRSSHGTRPKSLISDVMHWVKCGRTCIQRSNREHSSKRSLCRGNERICIAKIQNVWEATGGMSNQHRHVKLTLGHFDPDSFAAMNCSIACQIFSNSTKQMIEDACNDEDMPEFKHEHYAHLMKLIEHINRLVDITNGRGLDEVVGDKTVKKYDVFYTPATGRNSQEDLLDILAWFADWKAEHDAKVKAGLADEYDFLPRQTYENLNRLILGLVVIIQYYCIEKGFTVIPRRLNTDPCENLFSIFRNSGGSTGGINSTQSDYGEVNTDAIYGADRVAKSNNYHAPPKPTSF